ncbi:MAG: hypothetical protein LC798_11080 [Chloroflexi bacterium]|nr:hypothetical protein [Chloroflexota bacterium]
MAIVQTKVTTHVDQATLRKLAEGVADGVLGAAEAGKGRALDIARGKFRTTRGFARNAFAVAFDNGRKVGGSGDQPRQPVDTGIVGYFGYDWFVARFYETGTARQSPRPSLAPAAAEMDGELPKRLRGALQRKGFP